MQLHQLLRCLIKRQNVLYLTTYLMHRKKLYFKSANQPEKDPSLSLICRCGNERWGWFGGGQDD